MQALHASGPMRILLACAPRRKTSSGLSVKSLWQHRTDSPSALTADQDHHPAHRCSDLQCECNAAWILSRLKDLCRHLTFSINPAGSKHRMQACKHKFCMTPSSPNTVHTQHASPSSTFPTHFRCLGSIPPNAPRHKPWHDPDIP